MNDVDFLARLVEMQALVDGFGVATTTTQWITAMQNCKNLLEEARVRTTALVAVDVAQAIVIVAIQANAATPAGNEAVTVNSGTTGIAGVNSGTTGIAGVNSGTTGIAGVNSGTTGATVNSGTTGATVNSGTTGATVDNATATNNSLSLVRTENLGVPSTKSTTAIHAGFAGNDISNNFPGPFTQPTRARSLSVTFQAGWDGGDVNIIGTRAGIGPINETVTSNPAGTSYTTKVFDTVVSATKSAVGLAADTASIGDGDKLGLANTLDMAVGQLSVDGLTEASTWDVANSAVTPTSAPNGAKTFVAMYPRATSVIQAVHTHTVTDAGHTHTVTDAGHTHTVTDAGHTHTVTDAGHTHTVTDAGHTHTVTDAGHTHTATQPTHVHQAP